MIGMTFHLQSFTKLATYLQSDSRVAWTEHRNLVYAENLQQAAREMRLVARYNERVQKPVLHMSISWAPEDAPTQCDMQTIAGGVLDDLALTEHQTAFVAHADKPYAHVHMMANRIHPGSGRAYPQGLYWKQIEASLRRAERDYGFKETPGHLFQLEGQSPPDRSQSLSRKAYRATAKQGRLPFQVLVQDVAQSDFQEATSWSDLTSRLARQGLQLQSRRRGLVVTDGHEYAKSSSVAPSVSRQKLERRFDMAYEDFAVGMDRPAIRAVEPLAKGSMAQADFALAR